MEVGQRRMQSRLYKGLALFTPGLDLVYGLDVSKQGHWHHHLCAALQVLLDLPEPPLFLNPGYAATVDFWVDLPSQRLCVAAEANPLIWSQRPLLDSLFGLPEMPVLPWQKGGLNSTSGDILTIESYRSRFPQLWQHHNLIYGLDTQGALPPRLVQLPPPPSYLLRLYVSGHTAATAQTLTTLHELLPQCLATPYTLKVVDVARQPEQAEADQVTATPTLVRVQPQPPRRLVGKLDDLGKLQWLLGSVT